ncbi:hypothetical protein MVEG_10846 [Podila verticillata NRRL 6337]|nr:hypothetical protein MVEG_10846 [Podila verticillata NRRL 6337]
MSSSPCATKAWVKVTKVRNMNSSPQSTSYLTPIWHLDTLLLKPSASTAGENEAHSKAKLSLLCSSDLSISFTVSQKIRTKGAQTLAEALKALQTMASPTTLNMQDCENGDDGAQTLAEALRSNSTLTTLNLQNNSIGENGGQALAEALKANSTLSTLDLWHNAIRNSGAQASSDQRVYV